VPPWIEGVQESAGLQRVQLEPIREYINPLNSGQAMEFCLSSTKLKSWPCGNGTTRLESVASMLSKVPRRCVSLCVYANGKRKLLKRTRSRQFLFALDFFFGRPMKIPQPLPVRIFYFADKWKATPAGTRIRRHLDRWRPGYFDFFIDYHLRYWAGRTRESFVPQPPTESNAQRST